MYSWSDIRILHIEASTRCNASCPMCARNKQGGAAHADLPLTELSLADLQRALPSASLAGLSRVFFCGNFGDPAMNSELLEIARYLRAAKPSLNLSLHSNGGPRTPAWWAELAGVVSSCRFGIDGLEDTNSLYRQNVVWARAIANLRAFVEAGGQAEVDFLVFRHNEHQVDEARAFFEALGVRRVNFKTTSRFFRFRENKWVDLYDVKNARGEVTHRMAPPEGERWRNSTPDQMNEVIERFGSLDAYWDQASIKCRVVEEKSLYLSAEGWVFPCCWVSNELFAQRSKVMPERLVREMRAEGAGNSLSIRHRSLEEILDSDFFQRRLPALWNEESLSEGKPRVCAKTCGQELSPFQNQFEKKAAVPEVRA